MSVCGLRRHFRRRGGRGLAVGVSQFCWCRVRASCPRWSPASSPGWCPSSATDLGGSAAISDSMAQQAGKQRWPEARGGPRRKSGRRSAVDRMGAVRRAARSPLTSSTPASHPACRRVRDRDLGREHVRATYRKPNPSSYGWAPGHGDHSQARASCTGETLRRTQSNEKCANCCAGGWTGRVARGAGGRWPSQFRSH